MMTSTENKSGRLSLSREDRLRIAGAAMADPRTVDRYCAGQPTRGLIRLRIENAMRKLGLASAA